MTAPIAYLNGHFLPLQNVHISPLDRGFLFGDGVYEVIPVHHGKVFCLEAHIERLNQSLSSIRMPSPYTATEWGLILDTLVQKTAGKIN